MLKPNIDNFCVLNIFFYLNFIRPEYSLIFEGYATLFHSKSVHTYVVKFYAQGAIDIRCFYTQNGVWEVKNVDTVNQNGSLGILEKVPTQIGFFHNVSELKLPKIWSDVNEMELWESAKAHEVSNVIGNTCICSTPKNRMHIYSLTEIWMGCAVILALQLAVKLFSVCI